MSLIGILFCVVEGKSENNLVFKADKVISGGIEMPYRIAKTEKAGNLSVVIYLHGGSSKGNDNEVQMKEAGADSIANCLKLRQIGCSGIAVILQTLKIRMQMINHNIDNQSAGNGIGKSLI